MKKLNKIAMFLVAVLVVNILAINTEIKVNAAKPVSLVSTSSQATSQNNSPYIVTSRYDKYIVSENGMEFHYVAGDTWQGLMVVIPDPSRVFIGMPRDKYDGGPGASATNTARRYNAMFAVNGSFFVDNSSNRNGGTPIGLVFVNGELKYGSLNQASNIMGWDRNNNFICAYMTGQQAVNLGIRDAVSCKPILVQNGQVTNLTGMSTSLMDARTCVGARADGTVLILSVDGRMSHSMGATTYSLAECMISFGAVNAGNIDGGGSTSIFYSGPSPILGLSNTRGGRPSPQAICVKLLQ